jgi:allophanate hydrolase subunit 2
VRSYLAVAGGIDVEPVLGSRSTDTLAGLGPAKLAKGDTLPVGTAGGVAHDVPDAPAGPTGDLELGVRLGPRDDWFVPGELFRSAYTISPVSNRVGARLSGPALTRARDGELPSEGVVLGSVQVPADGQPLVFLADHPTTGGYPVIGVVDDVTPLAQARPGTTVRFRELH